MIKPVWCVTAINKLTGQRERVSVVSSDKQLIEGLRAQICSKKRHKPYSKPLVEVFHPDLFD